jgi:hypothetical protein
MRTILSHAGRALCGALVLTLAAFASTAMADPPSRVIRISQVQGAVSFAPAGSDDWVFAQVNRPMFYGDRLWADEDGRGELEIGNGTVWVGPRTALDVVNLDDRVAQFQLSEGEVVLRVRALDRDDSVEIDTPNLAFVVTRPGRYHVSVDAQGQSTLVAVTDGAADVYGEQASYAVTRGQRYRFSGTDLQDAALVAPSPPDVIERYAQDRERRHDRVASARYVSADVIGVEDLDSYGSWTSVADYGNVWVPRDVPANWAPYRNGHWTWIDPWGWTWVDDAPWGFAPFHYGRWAYAQSRWCWVPGPRNVRPVYAPALVAWFGGGGGGVGVSISSGPAIGWVPLAPREVYRPWYDASPQYIRQVNVTNTHITNVTVINQVINNPTAVTQVNQFVNRRAPNGITAVPPAALAQAQPVARVAVAVQPNAVDKATFQPMPKIAPAQQAIVGAAQPAKGRPPAQVMQRTVVAKTAPPPAPLPVEQRIQLLQKDPGKPLPPREAARTAQGQGAQPAAGGGRPGGNVRVVSAPKPAANATPPAKPEARASGPQPGTGPAAAGAAAPSAAAPRAAPTPPTAAAPARPSGPATSQPPREEANAPEGPRGQARGTASRPPAAQPPREEAKAPPAPREQPAAAPRSPVAQPPREEAKGPQGPRDQARSAPSPGVAREAGRPPAAAPAAPPPNTPRPEAATPRPPGEAARPPGPARAPEPAPPREAARPAQAAPPREAPRPAAAAPPRAPEAAAPRAPREEARAAPAPRPPQAVPPHEAPPNREAAPAPAAAPSPAPREAARANGQAHPAPPAPRQETPRPAPEARPAAPPKAAPGRPGEKAEKANEKERKGEEP